jgi:hypothetical protein
MRFLFHVPRGQCFASLDCRPGGLAKASKTVAETAKGLAVGSLSSRPDVNIKYVREENEIWSATFRGTRVEKAMDRFF